MNRFNHSGAASFVIAALAALGLGACTSTSTAGQSAGHRTGYGHVGCFDPGRARSFATVDDDVLLVDVGHDHFRVVLDPTCHSTDFDVALRFRGDPVTGRVCGHANEAVIGRHGPCLIQRVDWITPEEYDALKDPEKSEAPAAQ
jgi:hypothetical protein